jgi:anti-sigma factor RsiW
MRCLTIEELYAYLDGDLPDQARSRVEAHALACAACREILEDRRAFSEAASALPSFDVPSSFASSILARLETAPAPAKSRFPVWAWFAATVAGSAAFLITLGVIALVSGQNLWQYLARLQHGLMEYLQGAATAFIRLLKYTQIFLKIAGEFATTLLDVVKRAAAFVTPPVQAACALAVVFILAMAVLMWRRRPYSTENQNDE